MNESATLIQEMFEQLQSLLQKHNNMLIDHNKRIKELEAENDAKQTFNGKKI